MNVVRAGEEFVETGGVRLCVETIGDPDDPPVLLIGGASCSLPHWPDEFCERLAAGPRFVIRYDHRDTGRSVTYEPGAPGYTTADLLDDAIGILDALGIVRAHLVGLSMGGGLAQLAAVHHPDRVATLTLVATTLAGPDDPDDLPSMSPEAVAEFTALGEPDWSDPAAVVHHLVEEERLCAARSRPFDADGMRELVRRVLDRSPSPRSMTNHFLVIGDRSGPEVRAADIAAPTLVLHGDEDPLFPLPHGRALAEAIPGARLVTLEGTGHELPRSAWDVAIPAILAHTARTGAGSGPPR